MQKVLVQSALAALLALVVLSVLLPSSSIAWMRDHWSWFNRPMLQIELVSPTFNLVHAILFLLLGIAARFALPSWRVGRIALALVLLGASTEILQMFIPGRHPRLSDVLVDLGAGLLGWTVAKLLSR